MTPTDDFPEPFKPPYLLRIMTAVYVAVIAIWFWTTYAQGRDMYAFIDGVMCGLLISLFALMLFVVWRKSR